MSKIDGSNFLNQSITAGQASGESFSKSKSAAAAKNEAWNPDGVSAVYEPGTNNNISSVTYKKPVAAKAAQSDDNTVELSDAAQKLLEELKERYGDDTQIMVANYSSDEEANEIMSGSTKEFTVLIEPETLEKMAADEDFKATVINGIDDARNQTTQIMEDLGEDADKVESIGITVNADGTLSYFAKMREESEKRSEELEEELDDKREEKRAERKEAEKERLEKLQENKDSDEKEVSDTSTDKTSLIKADSLEDLLSRIHGYISSAAQEQSE